MLIGTHWIGSRYRCPALKKKTGAMGSGFLQYQFSPHISSTHHVTVHGVSKETLPVGLYRNHSIVTFCAGAVSRNCCTHFGQGSGPIRMTSVTCSGSETNITQCSHSMSAVSPYHQHHGRKDVGISCRKGWTYGHTTFPKENY